jgi:hypothetical protein
VPISSCAPVTPYAQFTPRIIKNSPGKNLIAFARLVIGGRSFSVATACSPAEGLNDRMTDRPILKITCKGMNAGALLLISESWLRILPTDKTLTLARPLGNWKLKNRIDEVIADLRLQDPIARRYQR